MKFVIKSLLFINLLLQMTNSLRKCFNQDQNLMLTIILLAFSLIGIIGLTVGNRFILIIFAACMTLILIASITIYAIGRTEQDANKPKVPYYTNVPQSDLITGSDRNPNRMKSFVSKLFNRREQTGSKSNKTRARTKYSDRGASSRSPSPSLEAMSELSDGSSSSSVDRSGIKLSGRNQLAVPVTRRLPLPAVPQAVEDYSDEPNGVVHLLLSSQAELPFTRPRVIGLQDDISGGRSQQLVDSSPLGAPIVKSIVEPTATATATSTTSGNRKSSQDLSSGSDPSSDSDLDGGSNMVQSQQWIAYERHLYQRYLEMVSQSIDLILLSILASWMALLLDEDSDQCFGTNSKRSKSNSGHSGKHDSAAPIYNYNGVRYSIKPDEAADSLPSRVLVHR